MRKGWLFAGIFLLVGCGGGGGSGDSAGGCGLLNAKIYNGDTCNQTAKTPVVALFPVASNGERLQIAGICTASLITIDDIVTSAHCFLTPYLMHRDNLKGFVAVAGGENGEAFILTNLMLHPNYDGKIGSPYDIAVATLDRVPNPAIGPLPISVSTQTTVGDDVTAFGYGTGNKGEIGKLKAAEFIIEGLAGNNFVATEASGNGSICQGDSGGPLVRYVNNKAALVGVNSFVTAESAECASTGSPISGFVNVQMPGILDFIREYAPDAAVL